MLNSIQEQFLGKCETQICTITSSHTHGLRASESTVLSPELLIFPWMSEFRMTQSRYCDCRNDLYHSITCSPIEPQWKTMSWSKGRY
jgi:hypothetical protein